MGGLWWLPGARAAARRRVRLEADPAPEPTQMVWANMMLHASLDVDATFARWHEILEVGGFLMFSTLGPGSLRELREVYAEQGWPSPHLPFVDMHDLGDQLVACGFADPVMDQERIRLGWSSPTALLDELRAIGGHFDGARHAGLRTPRWRARLHRALASRADAQGRIHLSFEIVYGHAFKAAPPSTRQQTATVSLESVRLTLRNRAQGGDGA
jgi:malonyl-CoA O-methyltransferase